MPKKNKASEKNENSKKPMETSDKPLLQIIAIAIVIIIAAFLLSQPSQQKKDTTEEAKDLYFKSLETGKGKTVYSYSYRESFNDYPVNTTLLKSANASAVFISSPVSEKKIYFFSNDSIGCLKMLDGNATCTMIEKSNIAVDAYVESLKAKFFDNAKIQASEENMKLLFDKGGLKFKTGITNKTVNGKECKEIDYTMDYDVLTVVEAAKLGVGPGTPRQFQVKACISDSYGSVEREFTYQYGNRIITSSFLLLDENWAEPVIERPANVLDIAFYDMLAEESTIVNELSGCFANKADKDRCIFQFSLDRKYAPSCGLSEKRRDSCIISVATAKNDTSLCSTVNSNEFRDDCYIEFAGLNRDSAMCSMVMNQSKTAYCLNVSKSG